MRGFFHLPEEVVVEILLRLPIKSLIRFKCVCKSWYTLINDPSFANQHLQFNKNRVSSSTLLYLTWLRHVDDGDLSFKQVHSFVTLSHSYDGNKAVDDDQVPCTTENLDLSIIPGTEEEHLWTAHHCNGILWFQGQCINSIRNTVLYNPANREYKILPRPLPIYLVRGEGFGYDSKANDHKFIRLVLSKSTKEVSAEMYSVCSSSWQEIKIDTELHPGSLIGNGVHFKGVYYWWWTRRAAGSGDIIVAFDMTNEKFYTIPLPDDVQKEDAGLKSLAVWNESVTLLFCPERTSVSLSFEIWVMNNCSNDVKDSSCWTKCMTIGPLVGIKFPVTFWKSDEFLSSTRDGLLVSYNIVSQKLRYLPLGPTMYGFLSADHYTESLVSINSRN